MKVRDSVADAVYKFGVDYSDSETEDDISQKDMSADAVADLCGDFDGEGQPVGDMMEDNTEPNDEEGMSVRSEDLSEQEKDPEYMDLVQDIKELEGTLSIERTKENRKLLMLMAAGKDPTEVFSPP